MSAMTKNILISGVGGQGILTASNLICEVLMEEGFDVKKNEIHGMSQRGGSVTSHIRYGDYVYSPVIPDGEVDFLVGFELLEGYRYIRMLKREGMFVFNNFSIVPGSMLLGKESLYPSDLENRIKSMGYTYYAIPAEKWAMEMGNSRVVNIILVGFLARFMNIDKEKWLAAMKNIIKSKYLSLNLEAFERGFNRESI